MKDFFLRGERHSQKLNKSQHTEEEIDLAPLCPKSWPAKISETVVTTQALTSITHSGQEVIQKYRHRCQNFAHNSNTVFGSRN
jgi:hypothetical protein